jgi:hypothetical protein
MTGVLYVVHRLILQELQIATFWKLYLFPSSGEGRETPTLLGRLYFESTDLSYWTSHVILTIPIQTPETRLSRNEITGEYAVKTVT